MRISKKSLFLFFGVLIVLIGFSLYASLRVSQYRSNELVNSFRNDYFLCNRSMKFLPASIYSRQVGVYWVFHYEHNRVFDQGFDVKVNLLGNVKTEMTEDGIKVK